MRKSAPVSPHSPMWNNNGSWGYYAAPPPRLSYDPNVGIGGADLFGGNRGSFGGVEEKHKVVSVGTPPIATPTTATTSSGIVQMIQRGRAPTPAPMRVTNDVHCTVEPNLRYNKEMQDAHVMLDPLMDMVGFGLFAVYDGHGGCDCAGFCSTQLHELIATELQTECAQRAADGLPINIAGAIRRAFFAQDESMKVLGTMDVCGSTATVAVIVQPDPEHNPRKRTLYVANVGDTRAVLCCDGGKASRVTEEHVAVNPTEAEEVFRRGGFVTAGRVNNILAVTRAFGDFGLKPVVSTDPFIRCIDLEDSDEFLILACDGLWDVVSDVEAVKIVAMIPEMNAEIASKALVQEAVARGSQDNITVMVIYF